MESATIPEEESEERNSTVGLGDGILIWPYKVMPIGHGYWLRNPYIMWTKETDKWKNKLNKEKKISNYQYICRNRNENYQF